MSSKKPNSEIIAKWYAEQMWNEHTSYLDFLGFSKDEIKRERKRVCKNFQNIEKCCNETKKELFEIFQLRRDLPTSFFDDIEIYLCSKLKGFDVTERFQKYMLNKMEYALTFQELSTIDQKNKNGLHRPLGFPLYTIAKVNVAKICYQ